MFLENYLPPSESKIMTLHYIIYAITFFGGLIQLFSMPLLSPFTYPFRQWIKICGQLFSVPLSTLRQIVKLFFQ
jgi:hypothetical protein